MRTVGRKNTAEREHRRLGGHTTIEQVEISWVVWISNGSLANTYTVEHMYSQFRRVQNSAYAAPPETPLHLNSGEGTVPEFLTVSLPAALCECTQCESSLMQLHSCK
jgi:hypothetical protein